jgi:nucleotide-binding universal stress UspA family protein
MLKHIVVAADETDASRCAITTALRWAARADGRGTIVTVGEPRALPAHATAGGPAARDPDRPPALESIQRWLLSELVQEPTWRAPEHVAAIGVPGIEIARFAEEASADLLVLGRKQRSAAARLLVGDTADAAARRSRVPCLFVPAPLGLPTTVLVALDGTARGLAVLRATQGMAQALDAGLELITVEPARADEPLELAGALPDARSANLRRMLNGDGDALRVRRGDVVAEILREVTATEAQVLAVGYHRGGPAGVLDVGSVARRLIHSAPRAVLTIPL